MRVLTVVFDRVYGDGAWIVVEDGYRVSRHRHPVALEAIAEAGEAVREAARSNRVPRVLIDYRDGRWMVSASR